MLEEPTQVDEYIVKSVRDILDRLGYDLTDQNFLRTPERVATWLEEFRHQEDPDPGELLTTRFQEAHEELVAVRNIRFTALCAHHLLPFRGVAHVGYIPRRENGVVGISKLPRLVHYFAKQLTLQERMTNQIANALNELLNPHGAMVVIVSEHECMSIRGVKEPEAETITSAVRGFFVSNEGGCKDEFLALVRR